MVNPIDDSLIEGTETVVASITPSPLQCPTCGYDIGEPHTADVLIYDNDIAGTNTPPFLFFYMPANGATFTGPTNITLRAYADDEEDRFFVQVEFFEEATSLGFGTFRPALCPGPYCPYFDLVWSNVPPGQYTFTARGTDSLGLSSNSAPAIVTVRDPQPNVVIRIVEQPQDVYSIWDCKAFFPVRVEVDPPDTPISYQWQRNGIGIPGATNAIYTTTYLNGADNRVPFRCRIFTPETELFTREARITLGGDLMPPQLRAAFRYDASSIALVFNYPVEPGEILNYRISPAVTINSVETLSLDPAIILLRTSPLTVRASYTVTASGLHSPSGNYLYPDPAHAIFYVHPFLQSLNRLKTFTTGPYLVLEWLDPSKILQSAQFPSGPWRDHSLTSPTLVIPRPNFCDGVPRQPHQFFRLRGNGAN